MKSILGLIAALCLLTACGTSARIDKSWRDPEVSVDVSKLNKVLVVALLNSEANRRTTEDKLVAMLGNKAVPSYNILTKDVTKEDEATIREKIKNDGFDGIVIMRLADVEKDREYVRDGAYPYPFYYRRFWGYYWNAWNAYYNPGYYRTTKTYTVETNVYSLIRDKLIWSSTTKSVDPSNLDKLMDASAKVVFDEMKKQGFITGV
ncbi:MAG TPA: hypothetical protein VIM87_26550 [Chitinophaga sp.]|uniref:hypothetical protein n=1 Tax=Chitinophaga sp. TaxID=1869181 RepID=UPI002F937F69